jgi:hypothetical protein
LAFVDPDLAIFEPRYLSPNVLETPDEQVDFYSTHGPSFDRREDVSRLLDAI